MAEIKVQIKGENEDFKKKMAEAKAEAGNFSEAFEKSFEQIKDGAGDLMKEQGLGKLVSMFGPTGLAVAVAGFGAALVDAFKEGIDSAANFEDRVAHLKMALGVAQGGMAEGIAKWVESISGAMGSVEENMAVFNKLTQAGMGIEEARKALIDIQNAAAKTGSSVEGLGDAFAEMKLGELPPRFFRENLGIAAIVKNLLGPAPPPKPGEAPPTPEAEEESLMARVKQRGGADWMLRTVLPAISPGGMQSQDRITAQSTEIGQLKDLGVQYEAMETEIGKVLLPTMKDFTGWLKSEMPTIEEDLKSFALALEAVIHFLGSFAPAFTQAKPGQYGYGMGAGAPQIGPAVDFSGAWNFITKGFQDSMKPVNDSASYLNSSADKLNRALDPK